MVILENYLKRYGKHIVLESESCAFSEKLTWIRGINGSGKSTLLKSMAGLIPFRGDIRFNEVSLKKDPVRYRRMVTYSEAEPEFPAYLNGIEYLGFIARVRKDDRKGLKELISFFNIGNFIGQPFGGYSSGMLKKISLCQAFVGNPMVILLDEPFSFIDRETESLLLDLVSRRIKAGVQVIFTAHHGDYHPSLGIQAVFGIKNRMIIRES